MELTQEGVKQSFYSYILEKLKKNGAQDPLKKKFKEKFELIGLPTKKSEAFQYLNLQKLYERTFPEFVKPSFELSKNDVEPHFLEESRGSCLVFVNGCFSSSLSCLDHIPKEVQLTSFSLAKKSFAAFFSHRLNKAVKEEKDPFVLLNQAQETEGVFLYLPPKVRLSQPIQCLFISGNEEKSLWVAPKLFVFCGSQSECQLVTTQSSDHQQLFMNQVIDLHLEEGAKLELIQTTLPKGSNGYHFDALRATLKKNSSLHTVLATQGGGCYRADYKILLAQENAEANLRGIWKLENKDESHCHILMEHAAPNCLSRQHFKGVLQGYSKSSFEGKIFVRREAQKTNAYQMNQHLLLGDLVQAFSKPNLEIFADDVKASHGSTLGQLDLEQVFYLKSRGLSEDLAKQLLVTGFAQEILDHISLPSLKERLKKEWNLW